MPGNSISPRAPLAKAGRSYDQAVAAYRGEPAGVFEIAEGDAIGCGRALQMLDLRELYLFDLAGSSVGLARTCARRRWWRGRVGAPRVGVDETGREEPPEQAGGDPG